MTADTLTRIRARGHIGIRLGLDRVRALLAGLGDPQHQLRGTLIAGTNGKGSVAAMVAAALAAAGYSTAQSPSPHLHSYRERIVIDAEPIDRAALERLLAEVLDASLPGQDEHGPATEFELFTAAFYLWASRQAVDVVVMEVGLGGRLDASNAWDADVAAVTNVSLDHEEFLGHDLASVAAEKAAIIKPGARAVTGAQGIALDVIAARAAAVGAPLTVRAPLEVLGATIHGLRLHDPVVGSLELPLLGRHQAANAAVAIGILDALRDAGVAVVPPEAVRAGLAQTRWPGRLELLHVEGATVLLDGAHNPAGVETLRAAIDELAPELSAGPATLLLGVMADKPAEEMLSILASSATLAAARFVATDVPDTDRAMPAADLAAAWERISGRPADAVVGDAGAALARALDLARQAGGPLVIAGSLYLVGHSRQRLQEGEVPPDG